MLSTGFSAGGPAKAGIKKRNDIPHDVLKRMHKLRKEVESRGQAARKQEKKR